MGKWRGENRGTVRERCAEAHLVAEIVTLDHSEAIEGCAADREDQPG